MGSTRVQTVLEKLRSEGYSNRGEFNRVVRYAGNNGGTVYVSGELRCVGPEELAALQAMHDLTKKLARNPANIPPIGQNEKRDLLGIRVIG